MATTTGPNFAELDRVLEFIEKNPEKHRQGTWGVADSRSGCGTAACFAGWTTLMNECTIDQGNIFRDRKGEYVHPSEFAQDKLNLTSTQAGQLFDGDNSRDRIRVLIERWKRQYDYQEPVEKVDEPVQKVDIDELLDDKEQEVVAGVRID